MNNHSSLFETVAQKPWLLIVAGFLLLISVWTFFFIMAIRNQPERLPLSGLSAPSEMVEFKETSPLEAKGDYRLTAREVNLPNVSQRHA